MYRAHGSIRITLVTNKVRLFLGSTQTYIHWLLVSTVSTDIKHGNETYTRHRFRHEVFSLVLAVKSGLHVHPVK